MIKTVQMRYHSLLVYNQRVLIGGMFGAIVMADVAIAYFQHIA